MRKKIRYLLLGLFLFFAVSSILFLGKNHFTQIFSSKETAEQKKFDQFTSDLFLEEASSNYLTLHYTYKDPSSYGIPLPEITMGTIDAEKMAASSDSITACLNELHNISYHDLTYDQKLTYDILETYLKTEKKGAPLFLYQEPLSPTLGIQAQLPVLLAEYRFYSQSDVNDYLLLLNSIDSYFQSILVFEGKKADAGLFMADYVADDIMEQCNSFIEQADSNFLIETFNDKLESLEDLTEEEKRNYQAANTSAVKNRVIPAYQLLIEGLSSLKGRGINEKGLCYLPQGREYYEYLVASETGSQKSVSEILQMVKNSIYESLLSMADLLENNESLSTDAAAFPYTDPEIILADLQNKIKEDFPDAADVNPTIKYVHESLEDNLSPAFYLTPPLDDMIENVIYINRADRFDMSSIYTVLAHEGYPGHLYQTTYFNSINEVPLRNILNFGGYTEGWATYVELYSYGIAGLNAEIASLMQLDYILSLGLYSRIDLGIHYEGWGVEQTANYLYQFGITNQESIEKIYHGIIEEPANYLKYFVGYLEITELKETAETKLGKDFVLKDFHKFLLDLGPAPFSVIENYMNDWISK